jgi:hypothetical protein
MSRCQAARLHITLDVLGNQNSADAIRRQSYDWYRPGQRLDPLIGYDLCNKRSDVDGTTGVVTNTLLPIRTFRAAPDDPPVRRQPTIDAGNPRQLC